MLIITRTTGVQTVVMNGNLNIDLNIGLYVDTLLRFAVNMK